MRFRPGPALGLSLLSLSLPGVARAEDSMPSPSELGASASKSPPADLPPPAARTNLIIAGITTSAVSYGLALSASLMVKDTDFRGAKDLRIPFAGPWLTLGKTGCPESSPSCNKAPLVIAAILTVFDGVAQVGGLGLIGEGLFLKTSSGAAPRSAQGPTLRAVPLNFEKNGLGLGVLGTF